MLIYETAVPINVYSLCHGVFKPGTRGQRLHAPGFLKLLWLVHRYACVSVCVSAPKAINNQWRDMV